MGWHFRASERLALVLVPSERDVRARNSKVLERIGINLLGKIVMDCQVWKMDRCGYTCPKKDGNDQVLERRGID